MWVWKSCCYYSPSSGSVQVGVVLLLSFTLLVSIVLLSDAELLKPLTRAASVVQLLTVVLLSPRYCSEVCPRDVPFGVLESCWSLPTRCWSTSRRRGAARRRAVSPRKAHRRCVC